MTELSLITDNGPTEAQWKEMIGRPEKYRPLIVRLAGYYIMAAATEGDRDFPVIGKTVENYVPEYLDLTDDEAYFVHVGAVHLLCRYGAFDTLSSMAGEWLEDGAPE